MAFLSRRTFLEKLGLGTGAVLLAPIAETLVNEARGAAPVRKRALFFLVGNCIHYDWNFTPPEIRARDPKLATPILDGPKDYTWPAMLKALEPWRQKMLLIEGLANRPRTGASGHSGGYTGLSCFAAANGFTNEGGPPGGITIDQYLANGALGMNVRQKSVLYGASQKDSPQLATVFAGGREKPEPHFQSPSLLFNDLFGALATDAGGLQRGAFKQRALLDSMRIDVKRLQAALAGPERRKLDDYLSAIDESDRRLKVTLQLQCKVATDLVPPAGRALVPEDRLDSMTEMAILALTCGLTNVVGVAAGCGMSHNYFPTYRRIQVGTPYESKGGVSPELHGIREVQAPAMDLIHNYHAGLIARMLTALGKIKEGDGTAADGFVGLYLSENGEEHHAGKNRWPVVVIGDAGGALKTDGRFLRYPLKGQKGSRCLADLYCSLATACGMPTDSFGKGGNEPVTGPLELLA